MLKIISKPMGNYQTNCYIVSKNNKNIIIDPGFGAVKWISQNVENPIAILNTHGHFDHIWSNKELKEKFNIPIFIPKDDAFMLLDDPFGQGTPKCQADVLIMPNESIILGDMKIKFHHFAGHTPGCSLIEIDENIAFSGDFIFDGSIGRVDFPYSNQKEMANSIHKFIKNFNKEMDILPGHGGKTTTSAAKNMLQKWIKYLS